MDDGSAFRAGVTPNFFERSGVKSSFSPPALPRCNGAIEAGMGSLKSRIDYHAALQGRPHARTDAGLDFALRLMNDLPAPAHDALTRRQRWQQRPTVDSLDLARFAALVARLGDEDDTDAQGTGQEPDGSRRDAHGTERRIIRLAFEQCGCLHYWGRRTNLPVL